MDDDLDRVLSTGLTRLAERGLPDLGALEEPADLRPSVAASARSRWPIAVAAAASVALVVGGVLAVFGASERSTDPTTTGVVVRVRPVGAPETETFVDMSAAVVNGHVVVWGGRTAALPDEAATTQTGDLAADGARFDLATERWSTIAPAPIAPRIRAGAAVVDDELYVVGGLVPGEGPVQDAAAYDPVADRWREIAALPEGVCPSGLVGAVGGQIIAVGACTGGGESLPAATYDPGTDTWTSLPPAPLVEGGEAIVVDAGLYLPSDAGQGALWSTLEQAWLAVPALPTVPAPSPGFVHSVAYAGVGGDEVAAVFSVDRDDDGPTDVYVATLTVGGGWTEPRRLADRRQATLPRGGAVVVGGHLVWEARGLAWMPLGGAVPSITGEKVDGSVVDRTGAALLPLDDHRLFVFGGAIPTGDFPGGYVGPAIVTLP